jgi:hypothetical protein
VQQGIDNKKSPYKIARGLFFVMSHKVVGYTGVEPVASASGGQRSIQLS